MVVASRSAKRTRPQYPRHLEDSSFHQIVLTVVGPGPRHACVGRREHYRRSSMVQTVGAFCVFRTRHTSCSSSTRSVIISLGAASVLALPVADAPFALHNTASGCRVCRRAQRCKQTTLYHKMMRPTQMSHRRQTAFASRTGESGTWT